MSARKRPKEATRRNQLVIPSATASCRPTALSSQPRLTSLGAMVSVLAR